MTYYYALTDCKPAWFVNRWNAAQAIRENNYSTIDKPTIWLWNEMYDDVKLTVRNGKIHLAFEDEKSYAWFLLKES